MSRTGWRATTVRLLRLFLRDLPAELGLWLVVTGLIVAYMVVIRGTPLRLALALGLAFLPLVIPLAPIVWLRWEPRARTPDAFPALGLGCLWAIVTLPIAIGLAAVIAALIGALR